MTGIEELESMVVAKKQEDEQKANQENVTKLVHSEIREQYEASKKELVKTDEFKQLTDEITRRSAEAELGKDMLEILNQEQKNALSKYVLECEKKRLDFKQKKEKHIIEEEIKAEVYKRKVDVMQKRYGHLYDKDENGNIKNFVPSKSYNRYKAFVNWWDNTSDGFKKITKGFLRFMLWGGIIALVIILGRVGFKWLVGFTKNLPTS